MGKIFRKNNCVQGDLLIGLWFAVFLIVLLPGRAWPQSPEKPHHTEDGFRNIYTVHEGPTPTFKDFFRWRWAKLWEEPSPPRKVSLPKADNDPVWLRENREQMTLTWIGHSTLLFQLKGKNILTDPLFSARASPVQWAGPKRLVPPGIALADLPPIDAVVISHDHYDSLDTASVRALLARPGGKETRFFVPLGLKAWLVKQGINCRVTELDWWQGAPLAGLTITAVPAQHWSKRSFVGRNRTLWAGWVVMAGEQRFFFAGDTGYGTHFMKIGERLGPFTVAAIPIGAYEPRWFMRHNHLNPEEAVQAHLDVRAAKSVAMHWGTFILTDEPVDEPPVRLAVTLKDRGIPVERFVVIRHGETIFLEN